MKKIVISCIAITIVCFIFLLKSESGFANKNIIWQKTSKGIRESEINSILINEDIIFAATDRSVYASNDHGKYFRKVLSISGRNHKVNFLALDENNPEAIYAGTENGLYRSLNSGKTWKNVFKGKNDLERSCNAVISHNNRIILATNAGLFYNLDNAKIWNKISGELGDTEIVSIALGGNNFYLATENEIFSLSFDLKNQNKLYSLSRQEVNGQEVQDDDFYSDEANAISRINDIKSDGNKIYFGSDEGLFYSKNFGQSWQRFNQGGLLSKNIKTILTDSKNDRIFVGTDEGIFEFFGNRWSQLYKGIVTNKINFLATDSLSNLWAATDKGVFKGSPQDEKHSIKKDELENILNAFGGEPSIQEIQNQAIKYAEVQPEKIKAWRKAAARSAWLPKLTMGVDADDNLTTSDSVWGSYSNGGQNYVGPDDKTYYNNFAWDVSLTWDFSELVWNSDQTSIDSRSKLMVELREDILDEVTRLYFERRRLQTELLISPPEEADDRLDKVLRLEELTASIDALTGGYLSKVLSKADSALTRRTN